MIVLEEFRAQRNPLAVAMAKLEAAVARLDPLVRGRGGRLSTTVEHELLAIAQAVSAGRPDSATERAERLADRLEHPAALG